MSNVRLKKEDMNALIMNFLVTEVRLAHACASIRPVPGSPDSAVCSAHWLAQFI